MSETCENTLRIKAHTDIAEKQLKMFEQKSLTLKGEFCIEGTVPCPIFGEDNIPIDTSRKKPLFQTDTNGNTPKVVAPIRTVDSVITKKEANNMQKYGAKNKCEWIEKNWSTFGIYEPSIKSTTTNFFCVCFLSRNSPPTEWLRAVSKDYPDIHFNLEYLIFPGSVYVLDAVNGSIVEYRKDEDDYN